MGIKNLNKYLNENCSGRAITKIHLSQLAYKTIIIDTSIYLYKFIEKDALIENVYLMISLFRHYCIIPVFVFDGKPPSEKNELLEKRKHDKKVAETKYLALKTEMEVNAELEGGRKEDILNEMEALKKKFVRIRETDVRQVKELMDAYGVMYLESRGEADQLIAYLTKHGYVWGCVSDDMDMFVYGCHRVLRHLSLLQHSVIVYDTPQILSELNMTQEHFRNILILSGTDYNINEKTTLYETLKWYGQYLKYSVDKGRNETFFAWLAKNTKYIQNMEKLDKVSAMFDLRVFALNNHAEIHDIIMRLPFVLKPMDFDKIRVIMEGDGFVFI